MAFDLIVRAFFADNGLSAGLAKANAGLQQIGRSGPGARIGLRAVETGARALAFEAVGLQGPLGKLASGLLELGGGSAAVLGVVAGVGAITLAYNALTKESREAAEAQIKLRDELVRTAAQRASALRPETKVIGGDVATARAELARLDRERAPLARQLARFGVGSQEDLEFSLSERLRSIDADRAAFSLTIAENRRAAVPAAKREAEETERTLKAEKEKLLHIRQQNLERDIALGRLRTTVPTTGAGSPSSNVLIPKTLTPEKFAPREFFISDLEKAINRPHPEKPDPARLAAEAVALLGALKQGGAGNILGGVGGGLSALSGIKGLGGLSTFGIIGTALGGVFNLFNHDEERRHREEMNALTRIVQNTDRRGMPDRTSVTILVNGKEISGAILDDVIYGIRRAERTNAVPVLPPR